LGPWGIDGLEATLSKTTDAPVFDRTAPQQSVLRRYGYAGHWLFGWFAYADEQRSLGQPLEIGGYTIEMLRDTFENWQSEFLQLLWQVGGLAYFLYLGLPQSKEGDERLEAKIDAILRRVDPQGAGSLLRELDRTRDG
jgi:hypothetical protein